MDNTPFIAASYNDSQASANLRYTGFSRDTNTAPVIKSEERDTVELSTQSLQLARESKNTNTETSLTLQGSKAAAAIAENENELQGRNEKPQAPSSLNAVEGTVQKEPTQTEGAVNPPPEAQTANLRTGPQPNINENAPNMNGTVMNENVKNRYGITGTAPVTETQIAAQPARYQENMLLQTVGTQIAQAAPPANIISVLG
jgi:hypothetical protein